MEKVWQLARETVTSFFNDEALSRGAAIAFFAVTSLAPLLLIVIAIAGLAFGHDAARDALVRQLQGLMGEKSADFIRGVVETKSGSSGTWAAVVGVATL